MKRAFLFCVAILGALGLVAPSATSPSQPPAFDGSFWKQWGDGQAELAGYDLIFPRYGHPRRGVAVAIFVTETFSNSARVKADPGKHPASDQFPVMKLNLVKDFQTGIYDYNTMTSSREPTPQERLANSRQAILRHMTAGDDMHAGQRRQARNFRGVGDRH